MLFVPCGRVFFISILNNMLSNDEGWFIVEYARNCFCTTYTYVIVFWKCFLEMDIFTSRHIITHTFVYIRWLSFSLLPSFNKCKIHMNCEEHRKIKHTLFFYLFVVVVSGDWQIPKCKMSLQWIACWFESVLKYTGKCVFLFRWLDIY